MRFLEHITALCSAEETQLRQTFSHHPRTVLPTAVTALLNNLHSPSFS